MPLAPTTRDILSPHHAAHTYREHECRAPRLIMLGKDYSPGAPLVEVVAKLRLGAVPGAPTALVKVTGMIVTARVRLRVTVGCEAPPP